MNMRKSPSKCDLHDLESLGGWANAYILNSRDRRISVSSETRGVARAEISRSYLGLNPGPLGYKAST
ncbi:hypothetical protein LSTR_LSTR003949 [Laodelphax striatellus]|uniref:Uncharacterized protein n=1 Tax=Laodelphax striatellus TaxID=195883 RepID=A0A482X1G0_LAOST|nr:hypothetical protein LSTR_LSTR003949 [Laodelphax striatellus]